MVELGKIQRPQAEEFSGKRKLYCVANIYPIEDTEKEYQELVIKYWDEVDLQIEKVEAAGKAQKVFCEFISQQGDEALDVLGRINERMGEVIKKKLSEGSTLIPLEDKDILGPYTDWGNCLRVVFTKEVFSRVLEFYKEFAEKRLQHFMSVIDSNLAESEAGLLFMKDDDRSRIQFPKDIEVFLITPPSYDDIMRWFREKVRKESEEQNQTG
jgi:hypothetical protein